MVTDRQKQLVQKRVDQARQQAARQMAQDQAVSVIRRYMVFTTALGILLLTLKAIFE